MEIDCKSFKYQAGKGIRKPRPLRMKAAGGGGVAAVAGDDPPIHSRSAGTGGLTTEKGLGNRI